MKRHRLAPSAAALAAILLTAFGTPVLAGSQYVVVGAEPRGEAFEPGRILDVGDSIDVPEGTVVTLLGEDGSVNAIPGPARITVTEEAVETTGEDGEAELTEKRSALSRISGLLSGRRENADTLGVTRSFSERQGPTGLDDPWVVSVHGDGDGCLRDGEILLGRATSTSTAQLSVEGESGSGKAKLAWSAGENQLALGEAVAADSGEIEVRLEGERALIRLHRAPDDLNQNNPVDVLGWMIEMGCEGQALALTRQLVVDAQ